MLCYCADTDSYYKLLPDRITWEDFSLGGGLDADAIVEPLYIDKDGKLALRPYAILPKVEAPNQILVTTLQNTVEWQDKVASTGERGQASFESPTSLEPGETVEFQLELAKSVMLVSTKLNSPGLLFEGFSTNDRNDPNPYTFQSTIDYLEDEGIKVEGESETFVRRYSFMSNEESPVSRNLYFSITNKGDLAIIAKVDMTYVTLE